MLKIIDRLKDGTTGHFNFNSWPDKMEVVARIELDLQKPKEAYQAGELMGKAKAVGELRQIDGKNIPGWVGNEKLISIFFVHKHAAGQSDDITKRNILAAWNIRVWNPITREFEEKMHVWELGCAHTYDDSGSRHNYGYHKGVCTKCGHKFICDSGD